MKKILSFVLAVIVVSLSVVSSSAYVTSGSVATTDCECTLSEIEKLDELCWEAVYGYGIPALTHYSVPGGYWTIVPENQMEIRTSLIKAEELIGHTGFWDSDFSPNGVTSVQVFQDYAELDNELKSTTVAYGTVYNTYQCFVLECNYDGYFPDELWNDYVKSLDYAKIVLDDENATGEMYNKAFFGMLYYFSQLCTVNQTVYDIDFDSKVTIMDATKYQRILAKLDKMNCSIYHISVYDCATHIQRYLIGLEEINKSEQLERITENLDRMNVESPQWDYTSWLCNNLFRDMVVYNRNYIY